MRSREGAVDENGEKVEAEVVEDKNEDSAEEEKKDKTIYYVTDEKQQSQYINMFKAAKMDAVMLTDRIDQPFYSLSWRQRMRDSFCKNRCRLNRCV